MNLKSSGGNATVDLPTTSHSVEIVGPDGKNVSYVTNHGVAEFKTDQIGLYNVKILNSSGSIISAKSVNVFDTSLIKVLSIGDAYCHRPAIITGLFYFISTNFNFDYLILKCFI